MRSNLQDIHKQYDGIMGEEKKKRRSWLWVSLPKESPKPQPKYFWTKDPGETESSFKSFIPGVKKYFWSKPRNQVD